MVDLADEYSVNAVNLNKGIATDGKGNILLVVAMFGYNGEDTTDPVECLVFVVERADGRFETCKRSDYINSSIN